MLNRIASGGQTVAVGGIVDDGLPLFAHPVLLGTVAGPADITTVLTWDVDPNAATAVITTSLGGLTQAVEAELVTPRFSCGNTCVVPIRCELSAGTCNNSIVVRVRRPRAAERSADGTPVRARLVRFATGVANVPAGQTTNVRIRLTRAGKQIRSTSGQRRLRGVMEIRNSAGFAVQRFPIRRIRLR
jgi:hypothetical protein